jgi:hypothetical protein
MTAREVPNLSLSLIDCPGKEVHPSRPSAEERLPPHLGMVMLEAAVLIACLSLTGVLG